MTTQIEETTEVPPLRMNELVNYLARRNVHTVQEYLTYCEKWKIQPYWTKAVEAWQLKD